MAVSRRTLLSMLPAAGAGLSGLASLAGGARPDLDGEAAALTARRRARELGVRIGRLDPGPENAITDVTGVRVGHVTRIAGEGPLVVGKGPVRTGVTAIWPHADAFSTYLPCGVDAPNGNGELSGLLQARRLGMLGSPVCLTNTGSVGAVHDALVAMREEMRQREREPGGIPDLVPVVGETWDGALNDIAGRHVTRGDVHTALANAAGGPVAEGSVGGGTGMIAYGFKGGIGTSSRQVTAGAARYRVGALVQANHGAREQLRIDGVAVGEAIADRMPRLGEPPGDGNSILMVLATDAPLLPHQLSRLARRAVHGLAKTGSISSNSSGDFALAFSTANPVARRTFWEGGGYRLESLDQSLLEPLLEAAAEAVEEAIVNALFLAEDMVGRDGHRVWALPLSPVLKLLARHGRLFARAAPEGGMGTR